ncbi:hypothetical protein [Streptomyces sp. NPDC006463]|uniref:hypothetical protein n=1 Tax=Streptomyces sp. NPDC006463 TaxID=3364746 RepID=UPI00367563C4
MTELARSQWTIENRLHFVRDTAFGEDASRVRTSITAGLRHISYEPFTPPSISRDQDRGKIIRRISPG